jgi:hypothetical protein
MQERSSSFGQIIAIGAVVAIILGFVMTALGPNSWIMKKWNDTPGQQSIAPASGTSVVGGPSLSAAKIDQILTNAGSPAAGSGQDLYNLGVQYNIDPAFALAVFHHESNYGKYGEAANSLSLGNLRCISGAACVNGYAWFNSWQDGYSAFYKLIAGPMYVGSGLTTPAAIIPKYAPSGDNNDPSGYIAAVQADVQIWRSA